jgi:hypothetical protein
MGNELIEIQKQDGIKEGFEHPTSNIQPQNKAQDPNPKLKKEFDLRIRLLTFSKTILTLCKSLPKTPESDCIRGQLSRSGMSIGANFEEADGALTRKDFINKPDQIWLPDTKMIILIFVCCEL